MALGITRVMVFVCCVDTCRDRGKHTFPFIGKPLRLPFARSASLFFFLRYRRTVVKEEFIMRHNIATAMHLLSRQIIAAAATGTFSRTRLSQGKRTQTQVFARVNEFRQKTVTFLICPSIPRLRGAAASLSAGQSPGGSGAPECDRAIFIEIHLLMTTIQ